MRHQKTKVQVKKKKTDNTQPLSPHPHRHMNQPPPTCPIPPSFIIRIKWTQYSWYKWDNLINVEV